MSGSSGDYSAPETEIDIDYGVLSHTETRLRDTASTLGDVAGTASGAALATDSFGILNLFLGQTFAQLPEVVGDLIRAGSQGSEALAVGVRGMHDDFRRAEEEASTGYSLFDAHMDSAERLLGGGGTS